MSSDPHQQRLEDAVRRRDNAQRTVARLQGRLAAARDDVTAIEKECIERSVAPDKLDAAITQLERRYDAAVTAFEKDITAVEGKLAQFAEDRT